MKKQVAVIGAVLLSAAGAGAQTTPGTQEAGAESELLQLLNTRVTVASKKATTVIQSPGVVSLITRQEILDSGARDLIDVLRMVPGLDFAADVQGVVGPSMRGIWGYEGKILLLWDGQEMNETLYGTTEFGNHFPVEQFKQIEIIRGPGSSIYGGYAELGVIKVTTLGPEDLKGPAASVMNGSGSKATFHQQLSVITGGGDDFKYTASAFVGRGQRSDQDFQDSTGNTYNMKGQSDLRPLFFDVGMAWRELSFRYVGDRYATTQRDYFSQNTLRPYDLNFQSDNLELKYDWKFGDNLTLTPRYAYRNQHPWQTTDTTVDPVGGNEYFNIRTLRERAGLDLSWDARQDVNVLMGAEQIQDTAHIVDPTYFPNGAFNSTGTPEVHYTTNAAYAQVLWNTAFANLTVGARWEHNSYAGTSFVPRVAVTRSMGLWHFKVLYARAFKPPTIENIDANFDLTAPIVPEKTRTAEIEVGRQIGSGILNINVFDTRIDRPIVFYTTSASLQRYSNFDQTGSRGFEVEYKQKRRWGYLNASYSRYQARNDVPRYTVPGHSDSLLGLPTQKATLGAGIHFGEGWAIAPSLIYLGQRYGYAYSAAAGGPDLMTFDADTLVNLNLSRRVGPFTFSAGLFDALDRKPPFIQAYNAQHSPLPGPSREYVLKIRYNF
jgi:outer membrane receptor protein involved in Fe transport